MKTYDPAHQLHNM